MLLNLSLRTLAAKLQQKEITSVDLVNEAYDQIEKFDNTLHSFITVRPKEEVLKEAREKDSQRSKSSHVLHGLPYSMKDSYVTEGLRTTSASRVLDSFIPPYNATVYQKLQATGAILIGKNNQDAWGHGGSTENTDFSPAKNPWNTECVPGGSSGGPAITVATRMVAFSIGEDTGGSIRNPASMCSISGLKVTYGRVSRYGTIAYASSLDTVGPMAKTTEDLAVVLECIAGQDKRDATSSPRPTEKYTDLLTASVKGKTIGLPDEYFAEGLDSEVRQIIMSASETLQKLGAKVVRVSIPYLKYGVSLYYLTALSETSSNMARYDGIRYGHGRDMLSAETKRRIMLGTYALSAGYADEYYKKAQKARTVLIEEFAKAFEKCDVLLSPVTPSKPSKIGQLINNPLQSYLEDLYTGPINLVGVPALVIPAGFTSDRLPVGIQLIGKKFAEAELLSIGHAFQAATSWAEELPTLISKEK